MRALPAALLAAALSLQAADSAYRLEIEAWRQQREKALLADGGWLTVTGLFWLKPGANTLGSAAGSDIVLPASAPARLGVVTLDASTVKFTANAAGLTYAGKPVREATLSYASPAPALHSGSLDLFLLKRGERFALRLKDRNSDLRRRFTRLSWFPIREDWRLRAKFIPHPVPTKLVFDTVIGERQELESPGFVEFQFAGQTLRLQAAAEGKRLFFVLRDATSGKSTYAASRFLYADTPAPGQPVVLDFNKAENPPCAFTPYATCPLPPPQNRLAIAIEAGEQKYEGGH